MFWENFEELCQKENKKANNIAKELDIASGTISAWKNDKKLPDTKNLIKIAERFNVSIDFLLDREKTDRENEKRIISAYRNNPKIKKIIDSVLGLEEDSTDDSDLKSALESPIVLEKVQN